MKMMVLVNLGVSLHVLLTHELFPKEILWCSNSDYVWTNVFLLSS